MTAVDQPSPTLAEVQESAMSADWSDGLPVVAPTVALLATFAEHGPVDMETELVEAGQRYRAVTGSDVVQASVLAGCRPEHVPVVAAAVRALFATEIVAAGIPTGWFPTLVVNGPSRSALGFNSGMGVFGPGFRANSTVGRAVALVERAAGKARRPGAFGDPGRVGVCLAEDEESSGWTPLHRVRGYRTDDDVVTAFPILHYGGETDRRSGTAEQVLDWLIGYLRGRGSGTDDPGIERHCLLVLVCPDMLTHFRSEGVTKEAATDYLHAGLVDRARAGSPLRLAEPADLSLVACGGSGVGWNWVLVGGYPPSGAVIERRSI
jgi:hypothetical protein